jgi:hypothetical protein
MRFTGYGNESAVDHKWSDIVYTFPVDFSISREGKSQSHAVL